MKLCAILLAVALPATAQKLIGWNDLGMHCMDDDYSVFAILPPFNTIDAHFINASGHLVTSDSGVSVTYEAIADPDGSINSTSIGKTNFWNHVNDLFGATLAADSGLASKNMPGPSNEPQFLDFDGVMDWFKAEGIPLTPIDDNGRKNPYPLMRLTAKSGNGTVLATTDIVLPVSEEMDCRACHGSNSGPAAEPQAGWADDPHPSRDYRLNILRLHDETHLGAPLYTAALNGMGYNSGGLYASVIDDQKPILCAACHVSEALPGSGFTDVSPLTRAIHSTHASVIGPDTGLPLESSLNRSSCYQCHPGSETRCLRGAMGAAIATDGSTSMQCQSCHGTMSQVGSPDRTGWLDEPNCQQCHTGSATHNNGQIRYTTVFETDGSLRVPVNNLFATNPDTPAAGHSLYRFSKGHGGLQCSACHGSTHAIYPALHRNDNLQNQRIQGHAGTLSDCASCHNSMPNTVSGGPHGMHPTGTAWIKNHKDHGKSASCLACHGADRLGTVLSRSFSDRTLTFTDDGHTRTVPLFRGANVSCFLCHKREDDGRLGGVFTDNRPPGVTDTSLTTAIDARGSITLSSTDPDGDPRTVRIVSQPLHGTVHLSGASAIYQPQAGFAGPDSFTYAASDGFADSNLGTVSVTVGDPATLCTLDGDGDQIPDLIEYSLGLSPDFPTSADIRTPFYQTVGEWDYWSLRIPRAPAPADAEPVIEFSSDLLHWHPGVLLSDTPFLLEARDPDPDFVHPKRFVRVRAAR